MDEALRIVFEMNSRIWEALRNSLEELTEEESRWRPLPEANNIAVIVRHLRIESEWHVHSLERGEPMPTIAVAPSQEAIDAVTDDFVENSTTLEKLCTQFLKILRDTPVSTPRERTCDTA